jgi:hypothetical protein
MAPGRLVFLDESGARTNLTRQHGRTERGRRLVAMLPQGHWQTTTMLAAIRADGLQAPMIIDGPIDAIIFDGYVKQVLTPGLRPGDVVVMTTSPRTRPRAFVELSRRSVPTSFIYHRTRRISIRSRRCGRKSSIICVR